MITKAGSPEYHGEFGIIFRDAHLNARNAFALTRPPEQRRIYESNLTGPIGDGKKSSFFFSLNREEDNLQSVVFAQTLNGVVSQNVATPQHRTDFSFRINRQLNEKTTFSIRLEILQISNRNVGVGGFTLAEAGANSSAGEQPIISTLRQIFTPRLVNELNFLIGHENSRSRSVNPGVPKLIVQDAFTGGGAQVDGRITENHIQLTDVLSWTHGKHFVISGVNIPDISRRGFSDQANFNGAFSFATLDDYLNKRPFLFSINQGDGHLAFWQKEFALFLQDQVSLRSNFSFALGLRYEKQNYLSDKNNFAPRLSFAYSPGKQRKTVLRGGGGIFYDRTGINPIAETLRLNGVRLRQINITNPAYPNPLSAGINFANQPVSITRFAPEMRSPYTFQFNLGVERQLTKALTLSANYINTRGIKLFRSRDINAPLSGALLRPVATIGVLREIESAGRAQSHAMELILRGKINRYFNGTVQYTLGRTYNDTGGINTRPVNNYDLNGEWSRADFDERHRFNLLGAFKAGKWINLGATVALVSGRPYSLSTGRDDNHDTIANDRPIGVRRNSLEGPGAATVDVRWSKDFPLKAKNGKKAEESPSFKIALSAFNVFNRVNFTGYVNNQSSPFFGLPIASRPARRVQLNFNFNF